MSLINEALKRAETDKLRRSPYFDNLTVLPPAEGEVPGPPKPDLRGEKRRSSLMVLLGVGMIATAVLGGGLLWSRSGGKVGPQTAVAEAPATEPARTNKDGVAAAPTLAETPPRANATTVPAGMDPRVELAYAKTLEAMKYYRPPEPPAKVGNSPKASPNAAPAVETPSTAAAKPKATARAKPKPKARAKPKPPAPSAAAAVAKPIDTSRFRVSAIMCGPDGNAAIINGNLVRAGQVFKDAKVVRIDRYAVELEVAGRRFTIRM